MVKVYVSGPLTQGATGPSLLHVRQALEVAEMITDWGALPFVPHLNAFWEMVFPGHTYGFWMRMDLEWLEACDAVYVIDGYCPGCEIEIEHAAKRGIPVFRDLTALKLFIVEHTK